MQGKVLPLQADGLVPIELSPDRQGCEGCATRGFCRLPAAERILVPADRLPEGVGPGDAVCVDLPSGFRVWLAFSTFILPLMLLLAGAMVGAQWGESWAIALGFAGLGVGLLVPILLHRGAASAARICITRC